MNINKWPVPYPLGPNTAAVTPTLYNKDYALISYRLSGGRNPSPSGSPPSRYMAEPSAVMVHMHYRLSGGRNPSPSGSPPSRYIAEPSAVVVHRAVKTSSRTKMTFLSRPVLRVWGHNSGSLVIPAFNIGATTPEQNQNITSISCQIEDPKSQYLETPQSMRRS